LPLREELLLLPNRGISSSFPAHTLLVEDLLLASLFVEVLQEGDAWILWLAMNEPALSDGRSDRTGGLETLCWLLLVLQLPTKLPWRCKACILRTRILVRVMQGDIYDSDQMKILNT